MKKTLLFILSATLFIPSALAGTMGLEKQQSDWDWVGSLSVGPVWENEGRTQTFYLAPQIEKTYFANHASHALFHGEIFLGMQKKRLGNLQNQFGVAIATTTAATLSGHIWDDADPLFDNYTYHYKIQHTHVAIKEKLLLDSGFILMPWVSGSVGIGFNHAQSFDNTSLIFEALPNPNFASHTRSTFTYTLGAGVQKVLNTHWQIGVGYEFADWGKSNLGRAYGQTLNTGLQLNHLYTNGVLLNLTYVA